MRLTVALVGLVVTALLALGTIAGRASAPPVAQVVSDSWDREGAARYLDEQMDAWFASGKKLKTGRAETVCISCHTVLPYALARPVLRRVTRAATTAQEKRLLEDAARRVETYPSHQLLYDFDEIKKIESRSTEAVLNALILARAAAEHDRRAGTDAARLAFRRLWETQRPDGAWEWLDFGLEPWETLESDYLGATLAALAVGAAATLSITQAADATLGISRLREYLKKHYARQHVFNRVWALLASTRFEGVLTPAQRESLILDLQNLQREDGGWSLASLGPWKWSRPAPPFVSPGPLDDSLLAKSDGFASGLIVYALREGGVAVNHNTVKRGLAWLRANQRAVPVGDLAPPAWRAHSLNFDREHGGPKGVPWRQMFMSNSATAFAVLALVGPECGNPGQAPC